MIHALSIPTSTEKINDQEYAIKTGLKRGYNRISDAKGIYNGGDFLNEGLTEELNCIKDNITHYDTTLPVHRVVAQFLLGSNKKENNLIEAYLSDSVKDIEAFEKDFDSKAESVEYSLIDGLKVYIGPNDRELMNILKGAINYRIKSCKGKEEIDEQYSYYSSLIQKVRNSDKLWEHFEDFLETLGNELKAHLDNKKQEMQNNLIQAEYSSNDAKVNSFISILQEQCVTDTEFADADNNVDKKKHIEQEKGKVR